MNTRFNVPSCLAVLCALMLPLAAPVRAMEPDDSPQDVSVPQMTPQELDQLLGPIALYPDALVSLIVPASANPTEIVLAARFLAQQRTPEEIDSQPWSESVKALARYPEIIAWMDTNLQWTQQLGDAFVAQPADVMNAVQHLRALARANGTLVDTPQQQVVVDDEAIEIIPAQPDVIYIPRYDPDVVYLSDLPGYAYGSYITFGIGFPVGLWLDYDFDWHRRVLWVGNRNQAWRAHRDWRHPQLPTNQPGHNWRPWHPPAHRPPMPPRDVRRSAPAVERPRLFPGTPASSRPPVHPADDRRPSRPQPAANQPRQDRPAGQPQPPAQRPASQNRPAPENRATPPWAEPQWATPPPAAPRSFNPPIEPARAAPPPPVLRPEQVKPAPVQHVAPKPPPPKPREAEKTEKADK